MRSATKNNALLSRWTLTLARRGADAAIVSRTGAVERTFADIEAEARRLEENDLAPWASGAVLALQIGNSPAWPALMLAASRRGLIPLPLGRHLERAERDLALATCGVRVLVEPSAGGGWEFNSFQASGAGPGECDFLKLTSGTTSQPRAIRFRWEQLVADCDNICETMGFGEDDLNFGVIPFSHSYGFSNLVTPLLCRGVPLVCSEDRMPRAILHDLAQTGATLFPGMPLFYEKLLDLGAPPLLPRLRLCISAGAPLPARVGEDFTLRYGLKIHTFYGSSECGGIAYDGTGEALYEPGFAGTPMRHVRIAPVESSAESQVEVQSAAVGEGYFPVPEPGTLSPGRFVPADLVRIAPRGLYLAGRATDVINIAGRKLNPGEVEAQLARCPGVRQVVVFGVPSALRHEEAIACVSGPLEPEAVFRFARSVLSGWQVPRDIWIVPELPVNERGKVSRRELARRYMEEPGRGLHRCASATPPLP